MDIFNDFVRKVKGNLIGTRYSSFWDCIVSGELVVMVTVSFYIKTLFYTAGVTLVTASECSVSTVSENEAREVCMCESNSHTHCTFTTWSIAPVPSRRGAGGCWRGRRRDWRGGG